MLPVLHASAEAFARKVAAATGGRLAVEIIDPGSHGMPLGLLEPVREGQFQCAHTTAHYYRERLPAIDFFTATPFGMTAIENYAWLFGAGGHAFMQEVFAPLGIVPFAAGNTGAQMGGWFRKEIREPSDLAGVRMRISGQPGDVLAALGGTAVPMGGGQVPAAFEAGRIDAAEFVGPAIDLALGVNRYASHYYGTWHEPSVELHLLVNRAAHDALPEDMRAAVSVAAQAAALETLSVSIARNAEAWERVQADASIRTGTLPATVVSALRAANERVLADIAARDPVAERVIASQRAFMAKTRAYFAMTEVVALGTQ
jgi:TRAP-type mannitol/chloroaromatic compound transport system substrate-binding protein